MESKYVPPHMRNKKVAPAPEPAPEKEIPKENDFPMLVEPKQMRVFGSANGKSFASLASSWARDAEERKVQETAKKQEEETLELLRKRRMPPLPQFHNVRRFVEESEDDVEEEEEKPKASVDPDEEGWTEVRSKKKYRKPKTFEERMARPPTPDESSKDETVWNAEDNETYWK